MHPLDPVSTHAPATWSAVRMTTANAAALPAQPLRCNWLRSRIPDLPAQQSRPARDSLATEARRRSRTGLRRPEPILLPIALTFWIAPIRSESFRIAATRGGLDCLSGARNRAHPRL